METVIRSLNRYSILGFYGLVPEYVIRAGRREGYFSLGIVKRGEEGESLIGMAVFYVGSTAARDGFAEIVYIYVIEEYRRCGVGQKLLRGADYIAKKSGVRSIAAILPFDEDNGFGYELSASALHMFFISCGYVPVSAARDFRPSILGEFFDARDEQNAAHWVRHFE